MGKRERTEFAQRNAPWLIPLFGAVLLLGIMLNNLFAMAGGAAGLVWVAWAVLLAR